MRVVVIPDGDGRIQGREEGEPGWAEVSVVGYYSGDCVECGEGCGCEEGEGVVLRNKGGEGAEVGLEKGDVVRFSYAGWARELGGSEESSFHCVCCTVVSWMGNWIRHDLLVPDRSGTLDPTVRGSVGMIFPSR